MNINLCVERLRVPFIASDACQGDVVFFNERELFRANYTRLSTTIWCFRESTRGQGFRSLSGANFCSIPSSFSPFSFFFNLSRVIEETALQHDSMLWSTACRRVDVSKQIQVISSSVNYINWNRYSFVHESRSSSPLSCISEFLKKRFLDFRHFSLRQNQKTKEERGRMKERRSWRERKSERQYRELQAYRRHLIKPLSLFGGVAGNVWKFNLKTHFDAATRLWHSDSQIQRILPPLFSLYFSFNFRVNIPERYPSSSKKNPFLLTIIIHPHYPSLFFDRAEKKKQTWR